MARRWRLIIADDHVMVREGLVALLEEQPDLEVVGQARTGTEAVELVRNLKPNVALVDITMPDMNGLTATRAIRSESPGTEVLILTMHQEESMFFEALRSGASGYVLKGSGSEELLAAIRSVRSGGAHLPPALTGRLIDDYVAQHPRSGLEDLTARELEVVSLVARGLTSRDIAARLTVSENTVKSHRRRAYRKLGLHDREALVEYAVRNGLISRDAG